MALGLLKAAIWPLYLILLAYLARGAPWPRSLGTLVSAALTGGAITVLVYDLLHWLMRRAGWAERYLGMPESVARQLTRAGGFLVVAAFVFLLPVYLLDHGLIAPEGRSIHALALSRLLILGFELVVWGTCVRLLRGGSALLTWVAVRPTGVPDRPSFDSPVASISSPPSPAAGSRETGELRRSRVHAGLIWLGQRRRSLGWLVLAAIAGVIALDVRGYSFTARRLAIGGSETALVIALAAAVYRALVGAVDRHAWRWAEPRRSWALALTSAVARRASSRLRGAGAGTSPELAVVRADAPLLPEDEGQAEDIAAGLRRLSAYAVVATALVATAWLWELNLTFVRFLLGQSVWSLDGQTPITLGDLTEAAVVILLGAMAWRYMNTLFALTVFRRMPNDPGVRFALVTLCRYGVLGLTAIFALGAIHLDLTKIGVVLAALGVGLGFGLQEIVSNFVCGIILLLERPIQIGDIVTVAGTTGKVDRINIRATTIINPDNQCMIVPNREFITGNLVNWTHKDKILRVPIKVNVAYGTDPERVVGLLLKIALHDTDVLEQPAPVAVLEGFGESALAFSLYAFVPEPSVAGRVRHRLCAEIQRQFAEEGITIPLPMRELHDSRVPVELTRGPEASPDNSLHDHRYHPGSPTPPAPHGLVAGAGTAAASEAHEHGTVR
jgi:potassium efflux system protein